jgi:hypothetical protein
LLARTTTLTTFSERSDYYFCRQMSTRRTTDHSIRAILGRTKSPVRQLVGDNGFVCELLDQDLWSQFHRLDNEMVLKQEGR